MKKQFFIAIVFLNMFIFSCFGQYLSVFPTQTNTLLWKIEGKKVKKDAYIFGTIHLIDKEKFYFPEKLKELVQNSDQIVLEIGNLNQLDALKYMMLEKGTVLDYFLPHQKDSVLNWAQEKLDLTPEQFDMTLAKLKPFALIQMATQKEFVGKTASYDLHIQTLANQQNIPVLGLETLAQQMAIFNDMDTLQQREMVMESIRNNNQETEMMLELFEIYLKQNVDEMYLYINNQSSSLSNFSDALLHNRNHDWIPKIEKLIKKKKTFIAVGAGHLGGEKGVLRLLEKQGYSLKPVVF